MRIHIFGANFSMPAGTEVDIWTPTGTYPWQTTPLPLRIRAGGDAADTAAGAGARAVTLVVLNADFVEETVVLATAGASASAPTANSYIRILSAHVTDCGTYTASNEGIIIIETTGGVQVAGIPAAQGQTQMAMYTIPAGKKAYLARVHGATATVDNVDMIMWQRQNADVVSAPFTARRLVSVWPFKNGEFQDILSAPTISFPSKTDVWFSGTSLAGGGGAASSIHFDLEVYPE